MNRNLLEKALYDISRSLVEKYNAGSDERDAAECALVLARLSKGKSLEEALGAPGDWGYEHPIGKAIAAANPGHHEWEIALIDPPPALTETRITVTGTYIDACNVARALWQKNKRTARVLGNGNSYWFRVNNEGELNRNTNASAGGAA